jgi:hypothetical protein
MLLELALECDKTSLPEMRDLFLYRTLLIDPENEAAHEKLGHRQTQGKWVALLGSHVVPWEDQDRMRSEWGRAWELSSEHATTRCNAGLRITTDSLLEVEYLYHTMRRLYGADLGFSDLLERLEIQIHADRRSFPSRGSHAGAYFDNKEAVLYTYVEGEKPHQLLRVGTVGILYLLFEKAARSRGKFPVWVKESWADHMDTILVRERAGRPTLQLDRKSDDLFRVVASARNPFSITRILNFEEADYLASSQQDLKYGQGYVLFHYLMHQDAYRAKFFEYLRKATEGQGQSSTFNRIFKSDLEAIERGHLQYAR